MFKRIFATVATAGLIACPAVTNAASIVTHDMLDVNQSTTSLNVNDFAVNVSTSGGNFASKTVAGQTAMGISGGQVHGEIDNVQSMDFAFESAVHITSLTVAFLYTAGNHGDIENEAALFSTDAGAFTLEAAGATSALWNGDGIASNDSPGIEGYSGMWTVVGEDIFGGAVTWLSLSAGNPGPHSKYGDYSFISMTYTAVPSPGSIALLVGACAIGRSRKRE